uniref:Uncharacterized protein n=1 Tax=Rhizophora mucronata TaxID=61149 RepID=A0A2P2R513_RHIMU
MFIICINNQIYTADTRYATQDV